jgi:hypothetical protein
MTLRRIQFLAVVVVLFTLFLASGVAQPNGRESAVRSLETKHSRAAANWTFWGCWTQFSSQPCRDVFRDQQGEFWICRACGTTGNPGPGKCNPISSTTLASGLWCS